MARFTRAEFLRASGALSAALGIGEWPASAAPPAQAGSRGPGAPADLAVLDARVLTMDAALPRAEAFAVKDGRFIAVGRSADVRNLVGRGTEVIDATGMTVTPGFIDTHVHPGGTDELTSVNLSLPTIAKIQDALRERAKTTPPDTWVEGFSYDDTKVVDETGKYRRITRLDLDAAVPDRPVRVTHRGGHISWYNSKAFSMAGVTVDTADPPGGTFDKEAGQLTGLVAERANNAFRNVGKTIPVTRDIRRKGVGLISGRMAAAGLTSVFDGATSVDAIAAYQDAYRAGEMKFRMHMSVSGVKPGGQAYEGLKAAGITSGFGDDWLEVRSAKFSADGSASGRTMAMRTPYVGRPDDFGILTMTQQELNDSVEDAHRHGFQIEIHANGDRAIEMVLNAYERAQTNWPRPDPRHRIEHCTLVDDGLLARIKTLGVIPEAFNTYVYFHGPKWEEYGQEKMQWMFAHRSFLDYGIPVANGSDYLPGPFEPLMGLQSMVTRKDYRGVVWGPRQKITLDEALVVSTINGARASFDEAKKGTITAGKLADFVILAKDPHDVDPDTIKDIPIVRTVTGGKTMFLG
ncbi:MAG: amidohydrolase [Acidobacteria bacterium]|nr:amidohydrolase [Acidobacteriota bacterium]